MMEEGPFGNGSLNAQDGEDGCNVASVNRGRDKGYDVPRTNSGIAPLYKAGRGPISPDWPCYQRFGNGVSGGSCTVPVECKTVVVVAKGNQERSTSGVGGTEMPNDEGGIIGVVEMKGEEVECPWAARVDRKGIVVKEYWAWVGHRSGL